MLLDRIAGWVAGFGDMFVVVAAAGAGCPTVAAPTTVVVGGLGFAETLAGPEVVMVDAVTAGNGAGTGVTFGSD